MFEIPHIFKKPSRKCKNEHEILDSTPVALPVKFHRPPTLQEQMQAYVRRTLNNVAENTGHETFEDANDFDVGEDFEPASQHEVDFGAQEALFEKYAYDQLTKAQYEAALKAEKSGGTPGKKQAGTADNNPSDSEG